jgi:hypothetical protein
MHPGFAGDQTALPGKKATVCPERLERWCASKNKTANTYVIEIAL